MRPFRLSSSLRSSLRSSSIQPTSLTPRSFHVLASCTQGLKSVNLSQPNGHSRRFISTEKKEEEISAVSEVTQSLDVLEKMGVLSDWWNVRAAQVAMDYAQHYFHCPWWVVFAVTGVGLRVLFTPISIIMLRNTEKMRSQMPRIKELTSILQRYPPESPEYRQAMQEQAAFVVENSPFANPKILGLLFVQILLTSTSFIATRNLSVAKIPEMMNGGIFPYHDLTIVSPFLAQLSGSIVGMNLLVAYLINRYYGNNQKLLLILAPISYLFMSWVGGSLPAGMMYSFVASNFFGSIWTVAITLAPIRRALGIVPLGPSAIVDNPITAAAKAAANANAAATAAGATTTAAGKAPAQAKKPTTPPRH